MNQQASGQKQALSDIYSTHHARKNKPFFTLFKDERGNFLTAAIGTGKKVIDIGCRDGALTATYVSGNSVLGLDIDPVALARAAQSVHIDTQLVDLNSDWNIDPASFDVVVAAEVLEHLYFPSEVLQKIRTVLRPGGVLVGSIPHAFSLQTKLKFLFGSKYGTPLMDPTHINQFGVGEFKGLLDQAGFDQIDFTGISSAHYGLFRLFAPFLFAHTILFKAIKKD